MVEQPHTNLNHLDGFTFVWGY